MRFDFKRYIIRVVKYVVYFAIFIAVFLVVFSLITHQPLDPEVLFKEGSIPKMTIILVAFSFVIPLIGYTSQKVYINNTFEQDREKIEEVFANCKYIVTERTEKTITFRHSSSFSRLLNMYEDDVVLDFSENPLVLSGARKNVVRFSRMITYAITERAE